MSAPARAGVVLAGGRSRRFGEREKALAPVADEPLLARVVERLDPAVDELAVSCRRDQRDRFAAVLGEFDPTFVVDPVEDRGPLAGLVAAADELSAPHVAAVACDHPFLSPAVVERLFAYADTGADADEGGTDPVAGGADGVADGGDADTGGAGTDAGGADADAAAGPPTAVLPVDAGGESVPTHAVYRTAAVETVGERLLAADERRLRSLVAALPRVERRWVDSERARRSLLDVDTPADWRRARRRAGVVEA